MTRHPPEPTAVGNVPLPLELAKIARTRLVNYEPQHPGLGVSASYVGGYYQITLYVYDMGNTDLPDDPTTPIVVGQFETSIREALTVAAQRSENLEFRGATTGAIGPENKLRFHVAAFGRANDVGRYCSFIFLTVAHAKFVKLRISFIEPSQSAESLASTIARQYFELLWPSLAPSALPKSKEPEPQLTRDIRGNVKPIFDTIQLVESIGGTMSISDRVIAAIRRFEPILTDLVIRRRPSADRASVRVSSVAVLATASLAFINSIGSQSQALRSEMDALVERLPTLLGQDTVMLDQIILDADQLAQAKSQIFGANATNGATALSLTFNICGRRDLDRMLSMTNSPLGLIGGMAAVVSQRLVGPDQAQSIMMDVVTLLDGFTDEISGQSTSSKGHQRQGTGCAIAAVGILLGLTGGVAGIAAFYCLLV